jgi:hypothetical protein
MSAPGKTSKPTAAEAWEAIDETAFRAEVDHVLEMSDDEVEAELLKAGFDPATLGSGEAGAGEGAKATTTTPTTETATATTGTTAETSKATPPAESKPAPVRRLPTRTRIAALLAAATLPLLVGAVAAIMVPDLPTATPADHAATLRKEAQEECAEARWGSCLDLLDQADRVHPEGAGDAKVKELRRQAKQGLGRGTR